MKNLFLLFVLFNTSFSLGIAGKFSLGIGYIELEEYRVDNEISPLPMGTNILPVITYQGENLRVLGPNITYSFLKGPIGLNLKLSASGDRYEGHEVKRRDGTMNGGLSFRLLYLVIDHGIDLFNVYNGQTTNIFLTKPFFFGEKLMVIPRIGKEYLSSSFTNYYYGVRSDEVGVFSEHSTKSAVNDLYSININYFITNRHSLIFGYNYKVFDRVISSSPTVNKASFSSARLFWSYSL